MREGEVERVRRSTWAWESTDDGWIAVLCTLHTQQPARWFHGTDPGMKVATFALERWMSRWEMEVEYDIAESGVYPLTTRDVINLLPEQGRGKALDALLDLRQGYTEARGTRALRETLASVYEQTTSDNILVTTGAI